ncbi:hypothetical protein [Enhydrobacter sp.]|uniref:hypothetical protein n=1 Tax=Enhydrobacter sp. TaxID=1894999 RepID=UPI0026063EF6|nr:hypothetical protein [Enhydrobacter sp.]
MQAEGDKALAQLGSIRLHSAVFDQRQQPGDRSVCAIARVPSLSELIAPGLAPRFSRWAKSGVWKRMFELLAADADNEYAMIDSTIVRAHQHSAGAQKKAARIRRSGAAKAD